GRCTTARPARSRCWRGRTGADARAAWPDGSAPRAASATLRARRRRQDRRAAPRPAYPEPRAAASTEKVCPVAAARRARAACRSRRRVGGQQAVDLTLDREAPAEVLAQAHAERAGGGAVPVEGDHRLRHARLVV